jgi:PTS system mannose-specific IIA component
MIGVLLVAHAPLASALAKSASHVYACAPERAEDRLKVLDVEAGADVAQEVARGRALIAEIDQGDGVIVLTDAFGATPGNIATQLNLPGKVAVVAGVNLPVLSGGHARGHGRQGVGGWHAGRHAGREHRGPEPEFQAAGR